MCKTPVTRIVKKLQKTINILKIKEKMSVENLVDNVDNTL